MSIGVQRSAVLLGVIIASLLAGCASNTYAPVIERAPPPPRAPASAAPAPPSASGGFYTVKQGDTLYSISLEHGYSHQDVAAWNNIDNSALIKIGQQLRVTPPEGVAVARPVAGPAPVETKPLGAGTSINTDTYKREPKGGKQPYSEQTAAQAPKPGEAVREPQQVALAKPEPMPAEPIAPGSDLSWAWPSSGKLVTGFSEGGNKGIDIGGRIGDPVVAAEAGKVTYAGSAIRGYGNLLIIQHPNSMSSVYAHNSKLVAKEGQMVAKGQKIAEVGDTDADQAKLHFEIRQQGKPLDPLKYLPQR